MVLPLFLHDALPICLFDDHLFIWLAFIYELNGKESIAKEFIANFDQLKQLPNDFVVSLDHMKKDPIDIEDLELKHLERFRDVKKDRKSTRLNSSHVS